MRNSILFAFICLLILPIQAQNTVFVSASASNDDGDGATWETAKKTIAAGVAAAGAGGTVFVKAGTYNTTSEFIIPADITVIGGYQQSSEGTDTSLRRRPGINSNWQNASWCTIISGAGDHRIATVNGLLDGCVVRYGFTTTIGGGLLIDGGTAQYCIIMWCDAIEEDEFTAEGGGAYIRNNGTLLNCVVTECRGDNGSAVSGEDGSLINNTITRNWPSQCGLVTDFDGNTYHTVQIGSQCWMKENLRTTHYSDGTAIPTTSESSTSVAYYYQYSSANIVAYGLHYNRTALMHGVPSSNANPSGVQGVCPDGWHVPSNSEWNQLISFVGSIPRYRCGNNSTSVAKALSAKNTWAYTGGSECAPKYNAATLNDKTRFSACAAGYRGGSSFGDVGNYFYFWTSSDYYRYVYDCDPDVKQYSSNSGNSSSYSVRCVKDPE